MNWRRYICLNDIESVLGVKKNNLLLINDSEFELYDDISMNNKIDFKKKKNIKIVHSILKELSKSELYFKPYEEKEYTATDIKNFFDWYNSDEADRIFPNNEYMLDAIEYWKTNVRDLTIDFILTE